MLPALNHTIILLSNSQSSLYTNQSVSEIIATLKSIQSQFEQTGQLDKAKLELLFSPTGPIQEIAIDNGWEDEFLDLAKEIEDTPSPKPDITAKYSWLIIPVCFIMIFFAGNMRFDNPALILLAGYLAILLFVKFARSAIKNTPVVYGVAGILFALLTAWMNLQSSSDQSISKFFSEFGLTVFMFVILPGIFWGISVWAQKVMPYKAVEESTNQLPEMSQAEFQKWYGISALLYIAGAVVLGLFSFFILREIGRWYFANVIQGIYVLPVDETAWAVVAIFLGIICGAIPVSLIMRLVLKEKYEQMLQIETRNTGLNTGVNNQKLLIPVFALGGLIILGAIYASLTTYTRFTDEEIAIQRPQYCFTEKVHSYKEVVSIQKVSEERKVKSNIKITRFFRIQFSDRTEWTSVFFDEGETIPMYYDDIINFVSQQSHVKIEQTTEQK